MIGLTYEQIIEKIKTEKQLSDTEIKTKIEGKLTQLGDLISKSGAAHIVANELGVKVYDNLSRRIKIKDLMPGLTSVDVLGKVVNVYGIREFKKETREGKVANFLLGDETGVVRVVVWDTNLIKFLEDGTLTVNKVLELKNAYIKENNGFKEAHLGNRGSFNFDVTEMVEVKPYQGGQQQASLKKIAEASSGEIVQFQGYVVQLFEPRFYDACPECNRKVMVQDGKGRCEEHGDVVAKKNPVVNFYLDDGSGNVRAVGFRDVASQLLPGVQDMAENIGKFNQVKDEIIGKYVQVQGRVVQNEMFNRQEFIVNSLQEMNASKLMDSVVKS